MESNAHFANFLTNWAGSWNTWESVKLGINITLNVRPCCNTESICLANQDIIVRKEALQICDKFEPPKPFYAYEILHEHIMMDQKCEANVRRNVQFTNICEKCGSVFSTQGHCREHIIRCPGRPVTCPCCFEISPTYRQGCEHLCQVGFVDGFYSPYDPFTLAPREEKDPNKCIICAKSFSTPEGLARHASTKPPCDLDKSMYKLERSQRHRNQTCKICNLQFGDLNRHLMLAPACNLKRKCLQ